MKKTLAAAAFLLLASTAAQAQYQFEYGGRTIRIDPDRGTVQIPGVYDNTGKKSKKKPAEAKSDPAPPPPPAAAPAPAPAAAPETAAAPAAPGPAPATAAPPPPSAPATAAVAPAATGAAPLPPPLLHDPAPPPPPPAVAAVPPPAPAPAVPPPPPAPAVAAAPAAAAPAAAPRDLNSPVGVWLTEEKEGKVRIEQCGANLCGYSVDAKSNANGEQVLINMRPGPDKWSGRILDPNTGSTYDSTIALKGPDTLRVQGCAFGGMFCGGQTWTRVN